MDLESIYKLQNFKLFASRKLFLQIIINTKEFIDAESDQFHG